MPTRPSYPASAAVVFRGLCVLAPALAAPTAFAEEAPAPAASEAQAEAADRQPLFVADALAGSEGEMKRYAELIEHTEERIDMLPIPGGTFWMGDDSLECATPRHRVSVSPFWMSRCEIPWDVYDVWMSDIDVAAREVRGLTITRRDSLADLFQKSQPTPPYVDMTFGMGKRGYPAICMTQHAARTFCKWLSAKTGRYYRLPTEAEWEYACRAGTETAYHFGDDPEMLDDYAWYEDNYEEGYERIGRKKPNQWGLCDMHGNVAEWVLDQYSDEGYAVEDPESPLADPLTTPTTLYPRVVRGGGWNQAAPMLRSASREGSVEDWIQQDPQNPVSIWYLTDATHVGFRVVRPLAEPPEEEKLARWEHSLPVMKERPKPLDPNR